MREDAVGDSAGFLPGALALVLIGWVVGFDRILAAVGRLLSRTLGRVSETVAAKTAPESVQA